MKKTKLLSSLCIGSLIAIPATVVSCAIPNYEWKSEISETFTIPSGTKDIMETNDIKQWIEKNKYDASNLKEGRGIVIINKITIIEGEIIALEDSLTGKSKKFTKGDEIELKMIRTGPTSLPKVDYYINTYECKKENWKIGTKDKQSKITVQNIARW